MSDLRAAADERFGAALAAVGARDPRDFYRERLRALKDRDPSAYQRAVDYYNETLIPRVAEDGGDPIGEWLEYGRVLAALTVEGRTVQIDGTGRSALYTRPVPLDRLVLHIPDSSREAVLLVGIPPQLSEAQRATYQLLVEQKVG